MNEIKKIAEKYMRVQVFFRFAELAVSIMLAGGLSSSKVGTTLESLCWDVNFTTL